MRPATRMIELTDRPESAVWRAVASRLSVSPKVVAPEPPAYWLRNLAGAPGRPFGSVAEDLAMLRPSAMHVAGVGWTRAQVTEVVLRLLEHETGVAVNASQLDASFHRDLGID